MSTLKVEVVRIGKVQKHSNADALDVVEVKGWQVVTQLGVFKEGDLGVYFPIDSILPQEVESKIFGPDSKIKLNKSRVKTIKLRGAISQGLLTPLDLWETAKPKEGLDLTKALGVTKFEPPLREFRGSNSNLKPKKKNPNFKEYTDIENYKNYPDVFQLGEPVIATEKIHGTNFRAGWVKYEADSWWKKVKKLFRLTPEWEWVYGSRRVQLQNKFFYRGYYNNNVYAAICEKYDLKNKIPKGFVLYGEVYGDGIQKGYTYGCDKGEIKLVAFDLMNTNNGSKSYLNHDAFEEYCDIMGIPTVPLVYVGPFHINMLKLLTKGNSNMVLSQKVKEGLVIKPKEETHTMYGRKILKLISDEYLLKVEDTTEFH